jgi:hypothetical protein
MADQKSHGLKVLLHRFAAMERMPHLEQGQVHHATRLVPRRRLQQTGQKRGAHVAHLRGDRVFQPRRVIAAAEQPGGRLVDETVGDAFVVAERSHRPTGRAFPQLATRQDRRGHTRPRTPHRLRLQLRQGRDARHFLDQVGLPCTSRRQDGTQTSSTSPVPVAENPSAVRMRTCSSRGISIPTRLMTRFVSSG